MARFGAVLTAMVTPFDDDLRLDLDAAAELGRWLQDHGNVVAYRNIKIRVLP